MKDSFQSQEEIRQNVEGMLEELKAMKLQMLEQQTELSKLRTLALLNPAQNCEELKELGLTQNGLYPLQGHNKSSYQRCELSENTASDCKHLKDS